MKVPQYFLYPDIFTGTTVNIWQIVITLSEILRLTRVGCHNRDSWLTPYCSSGFLGNRLWGIDFCAGNLLGGDVRANTCREVKAGELGQGERWKRCSQNKSLRWLHSTLELDGLTERPHVTQGELTYHWTWAVPRKGIDLEKAASLQLMEELRGRLWWELSVVNTPSSWGNRYFGSERRDLGDTQQQLLYLLKKTVIGFHCFTLPCVLLLSLRFRLPVFPSAPSTPTTKPEPMEYKLQLHISLHQSTANARCKLITTQCFFSLTFWHPTLLFWVFWCQLFSPDFINALCSPK